MCNPWRTVVVTAIASVVIVAGAGVSQARSGHTGTGRDDAVPVPATAVLDWNATAVATVRGAMPAKYQLESDLYMAYVQASVYDAVVKIAGRYEPYHDFTSPIPRRGASVPAAVAAAAYTALAYYFPPQQATLQATYTAYLAGLPADGQAAGVAIGQAAANDIIAARTGDGRDAAISTPYGAGPLTAGVWVFAPLPSLQSAQTPWLAFMRPFTLQAPWQFRVGPPPRLTGSRYARDLGETQAYGSATSTLRTLEQTAVAQFWNANATSQTNIMIAGVVNAHGMDAVDAARSFAIADIVDTDAGIACWDSKYHYQLWRPVTAIQHADIDNNPATTADTTWTPLLTTPNHPEYPAAHGCVTAAESELLTSILHTRNIQVDYQGAVGGASTLTTTRHYATAADLREEIVNARVWAGLHYRNSGIAGVHLGRAVARYTLDHYFQPSHRHDRHDNQDDDD
jgi:PAP2 superfamily